MRSATELVGNWAPTVQGPPGGHETPEWQNLTPVLCLQRDRWESLLVTGVRVNWTAVQEFGKNAMVYAQIFLIAAYVRADFSAH